MPADSGRVITLQHMPNTLLAGFSSYDEADYPLFRDRPFNTQDKVRELFPLADKVVRASVHALFGKPIREITGVIVDDYTPVPDGLEFIELKGGYWRLSGRRHFNGGCENDWPFDVRLDSRVPLNDCQHPRAFNMYKYNARGGYTEIGVPMRVTGKLTYEQIELPPQRVIGKLEAPPESIVTDEEMQRFYTLPENKDKGSHIIAYTLVKPSNAGVYYDKPLVKGVLAEADASIPAGLSNFLLEGGKYVKVTEDIPNGEPGWEIEFLLYSLENDAGYKPDMKRQLMIKQNDFGKSYEFYVPCGG